MAGDASRRWRRALGSTRAARDSQSFAAAVHRWIARRPARRDIASASGRTQRVTTYIIAYLLLCPLRTVTPGPRHATPVPPMLVLFRLAPPICAFPQRHTGVNLAPNGHTCTHWRSRRGGRLDPRSRVGAGLARRVLKRADARGRGAALLPVDPGG